MGRSEKILLVVILLMCAALRAWPLQFEYFHPDEEIAVGVAHHLVETGSLDTNWKNADLSVHFKLPQYNFSGYMLSAAVVDGVASAFDGTRNTLWILRLWSAVLSVAVAMLTFIAARRLFGAPAALIATLLVTLNPLLAQDAFYARPEPFVTALTLILVAGGPHRFTFFWRVFTVAVIAGILIATKISMVALLPLLFVPDNHAENHARFLADFGGYLRRVFRELPLRFAASILGVSAGFIAAAPFALLNWNGYAEGVAFLMRQYAAPQWPYGLGEATTAARMSHVVAYFGATAGALTLLLSVAGAAWAGVARNFRALAIFLCCFAFAAWFATYPTFFERNFSHIVPVMLIFAGYGLVQTAALLSRAPLRRVAVAVMLLGVAFPAAQTTYLLLAEEVTGQSWRDLNQLRAQLMQTHGTELVILDGREDYANLKDENFQLCGRWLLEIPHYHGIRSDAALAAVPPTVGFREVGRFTSHFAYVPTSSLHTYVMPTRVYMFRGDDAASCEHSGEVADPRTAGAPLTVTSIAPDPAWTKEGAYPTYAGFMPENYFGTWSWVGGPTTGTLRMTAKVEGLSEILLPYQTGLDSHAESIRVTDRDTGAEIMNLTPLPPSSRWSYRRIALPPQTREILIEAVDAGDTPPEWYAVGMPRTRR